ncbi:MAG: hypothetical protein US70_C0007G0022 [Parcubacteria group bacterium GW2011_GWD2_38_11]|nr:MAG: hypothetical protein US70_C0007G0022 [Parcubacteria group bacterium GW2011_GWD2_38_11]
MCEKTFILNDYHYSRRETNEAWRIRNMPDGEKKDALIKYFEIEIGKKFPESEPIEIGLNTDTAFMDNLETRTNTTQTHYGVRIAYCP